jgi:hypothetical protein
MKYTHTEGSGPILKSRFARVAGPLVAVLFAFALAAPGARAEVLVYEGFHSADYNNVGDNTQMTPNANVSKNHSVGFKAGNWAMNGSQPKVYGANFGLALPAAMTAANFSTVGGSIGLNPDNNNSDLRSTSHDFVSEKLNVSTGTLYVRMLLNLDSKAAGKLVAGASLARKSGGYFGFGLTQGGTDYDLPTKSKSAVSFVIWKNSSSQYVLSFVHTTASGTDFTSYPIITGISLDHTAFLGDTVEKIAAEKAGIIKENGSVLFGGNSKSVEEVIKAKAAEMNADYHFADKSGLEITSSDLSGSTFNYLGYNEVKLPLLGLYQPKNTDPARWR